MPRLKSKKPKQTLSQGLAKSANKKGLTGEARERYIVGGAINAEKRHVSKLAQKKQASAVKRAATVASKKPAKPILSGGRLKIELVARKNNEASENRPYDVFSVYEKDKKTPYQSATYRTRAAAVQAAKVAQESHNHPKGVHSQNSLNV